MNIAKKFCSLLFFFGGVLLLYIILHVFSMAPLATVRTNSALADLTDIDLDTQIARVTPEQWVFYPNALYLPEDFSAGNVQGGRYFEPADLRQVDFGTYHLTLRLSGERLYALTSDSINYAQRLFINGQEQLPVGFPAADRQHTIPGAQSYTCYFIPSDGVADIVIQYANFYHAEGGEAYPLLVGNPQLIQQYEAISIIRDILAVGCMFTISIFYFGMFLFFERKGYFAAFSICSLGIGLRSLMTAAKITGLISYSWHFSISAEYLLIILILTSFIAYLSAIRPGLLHRHTVYLFFGLGALYAAIILIFPSQIFTFLLPYYQGTCSLFGVYVIVRLLKEGRKSTPDNMLIFSGSVLFIIGAIAETLLHGAGGSIRSVSAMQLSMVVFILANMVAMAVYHARNEKELLAEQEARRRSQELSRIHLNMDRLKTELLHNITHEMKTPLTVMSGYAQLVAADISESGREAGPAASALGVITREAQRLSRLVDKLLDISEEQAFAPIPLDPSLVIGQVLDICVLLCERKGNRLTVEIPTEMPTVLANQDMLLQVLLNLVTNANRHTIEGEISIAAETQGEDGFVAIYVRDTGSGISPEMLSLVFSRSASEKNPAAGHGYGLPICREIIEGFGGEISIKKRMPKGTDVRFTLPVIKNPVRKEVTPDAGCKDSSD